MIHNEKQGKNVTEGVLLDHPYKPEEFKQQHTFISSEQHNNTTPEDLSERWSISIAQAKLTLKATTQRLKISAVMPLIRRYRVDRMFGVRRLYFIMATYTMHAKEQVGPRIELQASVRRYGINGHLLERKRSNQNPSEGVIRELRKRCYREVFITYYPRILWRYGYPFVENIMHLTVRHSGNLQGRTPIKYMTGERPDMLEYLDFGWYDQVWYKEDAGLGET